MEISPGIEIVDLGLWLRKEKILIAGDFHLGYEEMLKEEGVLVPRFQLNDVLERLGRIFKKITQEERSSSVSQKHSVSGKPEKIIINGDLKHEFSRILDQEWRDALRLVDFLLKNCKELILVKGNHDLFLWPIAGKKGLKVVEDYSAGNLLITHGDKIKKTAAKTVIIGHEHPAISLREKEKVEKYKCFLKGIFKGKNLIVMPSFNFLFEGTDIVKEELLSPYLRKADTSNFEVYVAGKKIYDFGTLKSLTP